MPAEAQRLANAYLSGRSDAIIPPELEMMACEYMAILKNAKKTGMRVIFVGSDAVKAYGVGPLALSIPTRAAALNAFAVDIINDDSKWRASGKFVALFGIHHLYRSSSATWSVPGIQCALPNCKSVYLFDIHPTGSQAEPGETFLVVSHDQKQNMGVGDLPLVSHLMADLYVGARMPLRMSMNDNQISDVAHRGVLALELPPGITYRRK
ncbi:hypothetical protein GCM10023165_05010 [Variovorax defluvii]|uniref:Uncharacterized protein n=1 Tax=Variovorax defluvii TaxID=913761 RepID=A0ABP8GWL3_9BURK